MYSSKHKDTILGGQVLTIMFYCKWHCPLKLLTALGYFTLDSTEDSIEEVTADHPEVLSIIEETVKMTKDMNFEHPYEKHAEILEEIIKEVRNPYPNL